MRHDVRFLSDEDFDRDILIGVLRRVPGLDLVRVQEIGLTGRDDPVILEWAAENDRILLTHDTATMIAFAKERFITGSKMPGLLVIRQELPIRVAIEEIAVIAVCSAPEEWENQIRFLPL